MRAASKSSFLSFLFATAGCMPTVVEAEGNEDDGSSSSTSSGGAGAESTTTGSTATGAADESGSTTAGVEAGESTQDGGPEGTGGESVTSGSGADVGTGESGGIVTDGGEDGTTGTVSGDGGSEGTTGEPVLPCDRLDVMFAIDPTVDESMQDELDALLSQQNLALISGRLHEEVGVNDLHFAVTDACPKRARYHNYGAGLVDLGVNCTLPDGLNYLVSTPEAPYDLADATCITDMSRDFVSGYHGIPDECLDGQDPDYLDDNEQPAFSALLALTEPDNAGFRRDDAPLVVLMFSDEDEELIGLADNDEPRLEASAIADELAAAGDVVVVTIAGASNCGYVMPAEALWTITSGFLAQQRGLYWDLCDGDMPGAVAAALDLVAEVCAAL